MPKDEIDHVARVHALWRREMPEIDLAGSRILARVGRIALMGRDKIVPVLNRYELDGGEYYVLAALRRAGPNYALRPTELYRALMVSSGGLTDRLRRLEKRGLVRRRVSDEDKRSILVELTPEGRKRVENAFRDDMETENQLTSGLSQSEREQLARLLQKLARAMEEAAGQT
jgi:DNA-binding MarR family transcriptional regulator